MTFFIAYVSTIGRAETFPLNIFSRIFVRMSEATWHPSATEEELSQGVIICANINGKKILVTRSNGEVFACGAICPHQGTSMEEGWVFDDEITCPEHSWVFSLRTGQLTWPETGPRIPIYPTRITNGTIEIKVEE
jgi:nitrite reductase/ring-hydroxylating ferredoxin subunit